MTSGPGSPDHHRWLIGYLARQGCTTIRSVARHGVIEEEARDLGCAPGYADAGSLVRQVAVACAFPRHLRGVCGRRRWFGGRWSPAEVVAAAWHLSDPLGRAWIEDKAGDRGIRVPAGGASDPELRRHWTELWEDGPAGQGRPTRASLAEDLALSGLHRIHRAVTSPDPDWARIEVIADACHRLPILFEYPDPVASLVYRPMLRDAWTGAGEAGRSWLRESAAALSSAHDSLLRRAAGTS